MGTHTLRVPSMGSVSSKVSYSNYIGSPPNPLSVDTCDMAVAGVSDFIGSGGACPFLKKKEKGKRKKKHF